jgi:hypothetical protein
VSIGPLANNAKGRCLLCDMDIDDGAAHLEEYHPVPTPPPEEDADG